MKHYRLILYTMLAWCFLVITISPTCSHAADYRTDPHFTNMSCWANAQPGGTTLDQAAFMIGEAKSSIDVLAYGLDYMPIVNALIAAHNAGVNVRVVADKSQATASWSQVNALKAAGIPVRIDHKHAIMHIKAIEVDGHEDEEGSINYTNGGENKNAEIGVFCHSTAFAQWLVGIFNTHWAHSIPL